MRISDHIDEIMRNIENQKLPDNTEQGLNKILSKTDIDEWSCMEDFLGNVFSGLQQNIYNLETYAIDNDDDDYDYINKSIAQAICTLLIAKNKFSQAKKNS
jgi:hypothetical protein